ncbi:hypothetical protein [Aeromonas veronii]|uniref:hypothetical protein n=1 Tax=Aeromonas veronii TaxID=654 RepID=UPI002B486D97|nr:hypothetical protein [Aeromonas veronii]
MIGITIVIGKDGPHYPTKVESIPSIGEHIKLTSYTDMKSGFEYEFNLIVTNVQHELIEFNENHTEVIKKHHHDITIFCEKI